MSGYKVGSVRFGQMVRASREAKGMTQGKLAEMAQEIAPDAGLHQTAISKIESGEREPSLTQAIVILRVLRLPLDDLAGVRFTAIEAEVSRTRQSINRFAERLGPAFREVNQQQARLALLEHLSELRGTEGDLTPSDLDYIDQVARGIPYESGLASDRHMLSLIESVTQPLIELALGELHTREQALERASKDGA